MNIRLYNARILTMEEGKDIFLGEIWIQGEKIIYVGDGSETDSIYEQLGIPCIIWDKEIDCNQNLLMPGFKNAHTHSGMTLLRSYADDLPLNEWLNKQIFPVEAKLTAEDVCGGARLASG